MDPPQEHPGDLGSGRARHRRGPGGLHGHLVEALGGVGAGDLVVGLDESGGGEHRPGVAEPCRGEHSAANHGPGHLVDGHAPAGLVAHRVGQSTGEGDHAVVELGPQRLGQGDSCPGHRVRAAWGWVQARSIGGHEGHRTLVHGVGGVDRLGYPPGGVGDVRSVEQDESVDAPAVHLGSQLGQAVEGHPIQVRQDGREVGEGGHADSMPRI